jgi:DNA-binding GntR family transcriptional regulator
MKKEDTALRRGLERVPDSWEKANAGFHFAMVSACGSSWLLTVRDSLNDLVERYRRASIYQKLGERDLAAEHAAIAEAVLARDADRACAMTERHFGLTAATLGDGMGKDPAPAVAARTAAE